MGLSLKQKNAIKHLTYIIKMSAAWVVLFVASLLIVIYIYEPLEVGQITAKETFKSKHFQTKQTNEPKTEIPIY